MTRLLDPESLARTRSETPGLEQGVHLNHAGASLMPRSSIAAISDHFAAESAAGPMEAAAERSQALEAVRASAASLIGASGDEIAFLSSGSAAFGNAFAALGPLRAGDRILAGRHEWGGNVACMEHAAKKAGAVVEYIECTAEGQVDVNDLARRLDRSVRLVSLTWCPANGGLINDAAAIGKLTRESGVPYFIDAGQALGQLPIDVRELQCDVLKGAGRKFLRGPRGTALLYVRRSFLQELDPRWVDVLSAPMDESGARTRDDARRFETSEQSVALLLGLGQSIELALELGMDRISATLQALASRARSRLRDVRGIVIRDLGSGPQSGLVSFTLEGVDPYTLRSRLATQGIRIGANGVPYTPIDMRARGLNAIARASFSYLNHESDIERLAQALDKIRSQP